MDHFTPAAVLTMTAIMKEFRQKAMVTGKLNGSRIESLVGVEVYSQI